MRAHTHPHTRHVVRLKHLWKNVSFWYCLLRHSSTPPSVQSLIMLWQKKHKLLFHSRIRCVLGYVKVPLAVLSVVSKPSSCFAVVGGRRRGSFLIGVSLNIPQNCRVLVGELSVCSATAVPMKTRSLSRLPQIWPQMVQVTHPPACAQTDRQTDRPPGGGP